MGSFLTASGPLLAVVFAAGIVVGWLLASVLRMGATIRVSALPSGAETDSVGLRVAMKKSRTMELKCKCGALLKFRDPIEPGYQPYPSGDSFTCSNCGKAFDLREINKLQKDIQT